ncbi:MAG: hypothetical protein WC389_22700 [Lutibacter sp.]|jgi:hypothetical protein
MIQWTTSKQTQKVEEKIAERAVTMAKKYQIQYDKLTALMDIDACHSNGNPLKLQSLLDADDFNFAHDVFGIRDNLNRETGKLEHCFSPRYSAL